MSTPIPADYSPYTSIRLLPHIHNRLWDIVLHLKQKRKRWNYSRLLNFALTVFLEEYDAGNITDTQLSEWFDHYTEAASQEESE